MRSDIRHVDVDGLAFRAIRSRGPASSAYPTVALVHGIGMSHRYLAALHTALSQVADVVSIDLPGFGGLPKPQGDVGIARMAEALGEVIDALGLPHVALVGHSMGAQWVVELAVRRPSLCELVVAIGPVADQRHRSLGAQARALALDTLGETPAINAIVFTDYLRCGPHWYLTQLRHMLPFPIEDRIGELSVPLLLIRGAADPVAGLEWCRRLRDAAPAARLVQVPRRHHVVQQSAPRAVASAILFHLRDADAFVAGRTESVTA